jgi:hypothetical protein
MCFLVLNTLPPGRFVFFSVTLEIVDSANMRGAFVENFQFCESGKNSSFQPLYIFSLRGTGKKLQLLREERKS